MAEIQFSHPDLPNPLYINTRPSQIQWSYGLNTKNFPTYAGEVVQILSAYIDNLIISGEVSTVKEMEQIYQWILAYIQIASQGAHASDKNFDARSYNETPVLMSYPHRGWSLYIKPLSLPTLTYGRDVIVPQWSMEAAVVEPDSEMSKISLQDAQTKLSNESSALGPFNQFLTNADIGYNPENPFERPDVPDAAMKKYLSGIKPQVDANEQNLVDWYNNLVPQYTSGNLKHGLLSAAQGGMSPYSKDAKQYAVDTTQIVFGGSSGGGGGGASSGSSSGSGSTSGTVTVNPAPGTLGSAEAALAAAHALSDMGIPYPHPDTHYAGDAVDPHPHSLDCSSSTSWVLHRAGMFPHRDSWVSGQFASSWGQPGEGKKMTVWAHSGHVYIEFKIPGQPHCRIDTISPGSVGARLQPWPSPAGTSGFSPRHWPGQ